MKKKLSALFIIKNYTFKDLGSSHESTRKGLSPALLKAKNTQFHNSVHRGLAATALLSLAFNSIQFYLYSAKSQQQLSHSAFHKRAGLDRTL